MWHTSDVSPVHRDLGTLAEARGCSCSLPRLLSVEVTLAALCVACGAGALTALTAGGPWLMIACLLALVECVSLLPLLVGAHWATVAHLRGTPPSARA
jgi:hypothetical protein